MIRKKLDSFIDQMSAFLFMFYNTSRLFRARPQSFVGSQNVGGRNYIFAKTVFDLRFQQSVSSKYPRMRFMHVTSQRGRTVCSPQQRWRGLNVSVCRGKISRYTCPTRWRIFGAVTIIEEMTVRLEWKNDNYWGTDVVGLVKLFTVALNRCCS